VTWQRWSLLFSGAGVIVAAYLTSVHYVQGALVCGGGGCHTVQASEYAAVGGIPVALLGLGLYLAIALLGIIRWIRPGLHFYATVAAFAMVLGGVVYTAYLTYLELAVIHAICQWCVVSSVIMIGLMISEGIGASRAMLGGASASGTQDVSTSQLHAARPLSVQRGR
jgi:uncharacterized membrane protein